MNYKYCLRYVLDPFSNTEKKNKALFDFVKKAKIDDVCFILNGEELNHSHLTESEIKKWLDVIIPLQHELAKMNITTSINPWTTIMHSDRGFTVNPKIGFNTFVDIQGNKAKDMACPADPIWRKYICKCYAQYASIHPKYLWLEDDFRHYNHTPFKLMCFCPYHMNIYQKKLGKKESISEFAQQMLKPGKPTLERKIYLDQARKEMIENEKLIEKTVHKISPETDIAQMTSFPDWHAIEGRDWASLFDAQCGTGHPRVARPHLPAYNEVSPIKYGRDFESYSRITAAYLGSNAILFPEQENAMWTPMVKSKEFIIFQIITTILLGAQGILLNLFDMMGNGVSPEWKYAEMLSKIKPFMSELSKHRMYIDQLSGIKILVDQDSAYSIRTNKGQKIEELLPIDKEWAGLLSSFSFATTIKPITHIDCKLVGEVIAISGQILRNFSDIEIINLIKNNVVLMDGESIQVLLDRKLSNLIGVESGEWHCCKTGYQSFEEADGVIVDEVNNPRVTMLQHTGNYLQLTYEKNAKVKIWSSAKNSIDKRLGPVMSIVNDRTVILPISHDFKYGWESQYSTYKQGLLQKMLSSIKKCDYLIDMPNVKLNIDMIKHVMWISNFSLDTYNQIKWKFSEKPVKQITLIRRTKSAFRKEIINIKIQDDIAIIKAKVKPLETIQILF